MSESEPIQSVVTTLTIIEHMVQCGGPTGVSKLARAIDTTKPRIYRHLRTLVDQGYVLQDPYTDQYYLTLKLFHMGQALADQTDFLVETRRIMPALRNSVRQTVTVGQIEEEGIRILDILKYRSEIEITTPPGTLFDFHSSAQGKVALAFGPDWIWGKIESQELRKWTNKTNTDLGHLKSEIARVKEQGWAVAPEESLIGINALAAPVFQDGGEFIGTISIVGSVQFLQSHPAQELITAVRDAAIQISQRLGFQEVATE